MDIETPEQRLKELEQTVDTLKQGIRYLWTIAFLAWVTFLFLGRNALPLVAAPIFGFLGWDLINQFVRKKTGIFGLK